MTDANFSRSTIRRQVENATKHIHLLVIAGSSKVSQTPDLYGIDGARKIRGHTPASEQGEVVPKTYIAESSASRTLCDKRSFLNRDRKR